MLEKHEVKERFAPDENIVLCHDDTLAQLKNLPSGTFRLVISSPPYNIGKAYEKQVALQEYLAWQKEIITEMHRVTAKDGSIVWQVGNFVEDGEIYPLDMYFYPIFKEIGMYLRNRIIWHFGHGLHASNRFSGRYEVLLWFTKSKKYVFNLDAVRIPSKYPGKLHYKGEKSGQPSGNPLGKNPSDFWEVIREEWKNGIIEIPNVKSNHPEKTIHPCQFPVELIERCVLALTHEKDWVLDPFGGVGSSLIASVRHNRRGMIIEKEKIYLDLALQRIKDFQNGVLKTRPLGKAIHTPSGKEKVAQRPEQWQNQLQDSLI